MDELSSEDQQIIQRCLDTIVSVVVDVQIGKFNVRRTKHPEGTIDKASVEAISECHNYSKRYEEENVNNKNDNQPSISNISEEAEQTKKPYNTRYKKKKQCSCGLAKYTNKQTDIPDPIDLTKLSSTNTFVPYQIKWKSPTCQDVGICMCQTTDEVEKQLTTCTTENNEACTLGEKSNSSGKRSSLLPYLVNQKSEERGLSLLEEEETQILHYPWLRYRSQTMEITTSENNIGYSVVQERGIQTMYADLPTDDEGEDERISGYLMESDIRSTANSVSMEEGEEENNKSQFSFEDQKMNYSNASHEGGEEMEISEENQSCSDEDLTQQPIKIEYVNDEMIVVDSAEICRPKLNSGIILMEPNPDDWTNLKHDYEYSTTLVNAYNSITKCDNYKYDYEQVGTEMPSATNEKALPDIPIEEENLMSIVDHQNETQIDSPEDTEEFPENPCKGEELTNKFICKLYKECKGMEGTTKILHHCVCSVLNICIEKSTVNPISLQMKAKKVFEKCRRLKNNTSRSAEFEAFENDLFILPRKKTETKNKVKIEIEGLKDEINNLLSLNEKLKKRQCIAIIKKKRLYQRMNRKNALIEKLSKKLKTVRKIAESRAQELFETTKKLHEKKKTTDIQKLRNFKSVESQTKMCLITLPKTLKHKETQCNTAKNDVLALSSQLHYWQCRAVLKTCHFDDDRPEIIVSNESKTGTSGSHSNQ